SPQTLDAAACHRTRIAYGGNDTGDAGRDDRVDTGWRLTAVCAGLERHEECGAARALSLPHPFRLPLRGSAQRGDFGVRLTVAGVESFADERAAAHDNGADHRIRRRLTPAASRELERSLHEM